MDNKGKREKSKRSSSQSWSLKYLELGDDQVTEPRVLETRIVDDPKQGGKTRNEDSMVLDKETLHVPWDDTALNNLASPNETDIINKDENYKEAHDHHKAVHFIESNNDIIPAKLMVAEITREKKIMLLARIRHSGL